MTKKISYLPVIAGILTLLIFLIIVEYLVWLEYDRDYQTMKARNYTAVGLVRAKLETEINRTMYLGLGLSSFVSATPEFSPGQFNRMAATLVSLHASIHHVALAPGNVVRYVYPLNDNEKILGLDYLKDPSQRDAVLRAMKEKQSVLAGLKFAQGGQGLVNRIPIFPLDKNGRYYYWGMASIAIDPIPLYSAAGLNSQDFTFALRGKNINGARGDMLWGEQDVFNDPRAIVMDVSVPGGVWQLAGQPANDLMDAAARRKMRHMVGIILAIGCGLSVWLIFKAHITIKSLALHDPLTSLPNRRYLEAMADSQIAFAKRNQSEFTILHLDLDYFKDINDEYGHKAGDAVLVNVAHCARKALRESDFVARIGGDEFVVLLPDTGAGAGLEELIERLRTFIIQPINHEGHQLKINASIGSAVYPGSGQKLDQLIKEADAKMYLEKKRHKQTA
ncbi:MAG TPA: diguanylate cyclase [Desulfuromonadaceae bacterium]